MKRTRLEFLQHEQLRRAHNLKTTGYLSRGSVVELAATHNRGNALGSRIMDTAEDKEIELADLASAVGISLSTMRQILAGTINCPPRRRLTAIARRLGISESSLVTAAERDGCEYE